MELKKLIDRIGNLGFQKHKGASLYELNKTNNRFFFDPGTMFLQVYTTRDGSTAKGRGFTPDVFRSKSSTKVDNVEDLENLIQGF